MWAKYTTASNELVKAPTLPIHHHRNLIDNGGNGRQRRVSQSPPHSLLLLLPCSCNWQHIKTDPHLPLSFSLYSLSVYLPLVTCASLPSYSVSAFSMQSFNFLTCSSWSAVAVAVNVCICLCLCLCRGFYRCPCLATGGLLTTQFVTHTFAYTVRDTCIVSLLIYVVKSCILVTF